MVSTPRDDVDSLWAALLEGVPEAELDAPTSAMDVNVSLATRMADGHGEQHVKFRLSGRGVQQNHVHVRAAAAALASFQEVVSSVGAALESVPTLFGQISGSVRQATTLNLSPVLLPGSVVFALHFPQIDEGLFAEVEAGRTPTLLEQSLEALIELFDELSKDEVGDQAVVAAVRRLGPRSAKHLGDLSQVVLAEGVAIDLDWRRDGAAPQRALLGARSASFLKEVVNRSESQMTTAVQDFVGVLITVSTEDPAALRLGDGDKLPLRLDPDIDVDLGPYFRTRVRVTVRTELTINGNTGRESTIHYLLAVQPEDRSDS